MVLVRRQPLLQMQFIRFSANQHQLRLPLTREITRSLTESMKRRIVLLVFCFFSSLLGSKSLCAADGWRQLFNGRDLTGWKTNVHPESFQVSDGMLRAHCTARNQRSHLFCVGESGELEIFKNFELVVVFRGEPSSNSGVFFHTDMSTRDGKLHLAKGYEVNLNNTPSEKQKTGSLYSVVTVSDSGVDDTRWTTLNLKVREKRIVVSLNGKKVTDYSEPDNVQRPAKRSGRLLDPKGGGIALQAHDPDSVYFFREIRIRELR